MYTPIPAVLVGERVAEQRDTGAGLGRQARRIMTI